MIDSKVFLFIIAKHQLITKLPEKNLPFSPSQIYFFILLVPIAIIYSEILIINAEFDF